MERKEKPAEGLDDQEKTKKLLEIQSQKIEEEINRIKMMRNGKTAKIFKMRELVSGSKMEPNEPHPVRNTEGDLVFSNEEIKKISLEHVLKTFQNKEPHEEAKQIVKIKEYVHEVRMKEKSLDEFKITKEKFNVAIQDLAKKNKRSYDFLTK